MRAARRTTTALVVGALGAALVAAVPTTASAVAPQPVGPETVVAGGWGIGGPAAQARFGTGEPSVAVLPDGRIAWTEPDGHAVHVRALDGTVACLAGCGHSSGFSGDGGPATAAQLDRPSGLASAADGTLYISDTGNARLRRIALDGTISTVAGTGATSTWTASGTATGIDVAPGPVVVAADGGVFFYDAGARRTVRKLVGTDLTTVVGGATGQDLPWDTLWEGGPATAVTLGSLSNATSLAVAPDKSLLLALPAEGRVLRVPLAGTIATVAGTGPGIVEDLGDGGPATAANLAYPLAVVAEADGSIDVGTATAIRHFTVGGTITTKVAGIGGSTTLKLRSGAFVTTGLASSRFVIRSTTAGGTTTVLVGAKGAQTGDGQNLADAWFSEVKDTLTLADGSLVVSQGDGLVRAASADGAVSTIAGTTLGSSTFSGEGGPATSAVLPHPGALARDLDGNLYVACGDGSVREILAVDGTIRTVLGTGTPWASSPPTGPLAGTSMPLSTIVSLSAAADGSLWVVDTDGSNVSRVVHLVAGTASQVNGTEAVLSGSAAVGHGLGVLEYVAAFGLAADGSAAAVDRNGWLYRTSLAGTITSVENLGGTWSTVRATSNGGLLVAGPVEVRRLNPDGSSESFTGLSVGSAWSSGAQRLTWWLVGSGLLQRALPDDVARPTAPVGVIGADASGTWQALKVSSPLPTGAYLEVLAYPGAAQAHVPLGATQGLPADSSGTWITQVDGATLGSTVTVVARIVDTIGHTTSVPSTWTFVWALPHQCSLAPTSRVVAYGAAVTPVATVRRATAATAGIAGSWTVVPGGLKALRYTAVATSSLGRTAKALKILRTTKVTYTATSVGGVSGCAATTTYSVKGLLTAVPSATTARRGAVVRVTGVLTPRVAKQYVTLQRLVGKKWVALTRGLTSSTGVVVLATRLPRTAGYSYYRLVSSTSTALVAGASRAVRIRAT